MCVDLDADRLYWVNAGSATMQYLDIASGKVTTVSKQCCRRRCVFEVRVVVCHADDILVQLETEARARPVALDVFGGELLWADGERGAIWACDKERCAARTARLLRNDTGQPFVASFNKVYISSEVWRLFWVTNINNGF